MLTASAARSPVAMGAIAEFLSLTPTPSGANSTPAASSAALMRASVLALAILLPDSVYAKVFKLILTLDESSICGQPRRRRAAFICSGVMLNLRPFRIPALPKINLL